MIAVGIVKAMVGYEAKITAVQDSPKVWNIIIVLILGII
jgi:hypothetical protein